MSRRAHPPLAVALAMLASACGPGSYDELRDQLVQASCTWARRCGQVGAADRAACPVDEVLAIFHDTAAERATAHAVDVSGSIAAGRMRYDQVNASNCRDAVAGAACEPVLAARQRRAACNAVVAPHTETDRPCWGDLECTGGVCARQLGCAGVCIAYGSPGAPCVDEDSSPQATRCDPSVAYCGTSTLGEAPSCQRKQQRDRACTETRECAFDYTCRLGHCVPPVEVGEHEPCGGIDPCRQGTYCDPTSLLCTAQRGRGLECTSRLGCEDGLACLGLVEGPVVEGPAPVVSPGVCADWLDLGAPCSEVGVSGCPTRSQLCAQGVCTARASACDFGDCGGLTPAAGLGESCADRPCQEGLGCDERMRCGWLLATFGDCGRERAGLCEPGLSCTATGTDTFERPGQCLRLDVPACFIDATGA